MAKRVQLPGNGWIGTKLIDCERETLLEVSDNITIISASLVGGDYTTMHNLKLSLLDKLSDLLPFKRRLLIIKLFQEKHITDCVGQLAIFLQLLNGNFKDGFTQSLIKLVPRF